MKKFFLKNIDFINLFSTDFKRNTFKKLLVFQITRYNMCAAVTYTLSKVD